jgi:hypothetical protein
MMTFDADNLIRGAKPAVPPTARERVLGYIEAGGAAASVPAPFRMLTRVAALVLIALGAGIATTMITEQTVASNSVDVFVEFTAERPDIDILRTRVENLEVHNPAARLASLEQQVAELETERDQAMHGLVVDVLNAREQQRMEEWRERHIQYVREHVKRITDATVEQLRKDVNLTAAQEVEVRALLGDAGKEAEALIGNYYGHGRHSSHSQFEKLARETDEKLSVLLSEQQREQVGTGLVSAKPEDWGPSSEFRDGTDYDVYMNWMSVSRK